MTQVPKAGERRYVRAIEAAWSRIQGRPVVISEREFELVDGWRKRGIPLATVLEVLGDLERRRGGRTPRSLAYLQPAVDRAWAPVAAGRVVPPTLPKPTAPPLVPSLAWVAARPGLPEETPLRLLVDRLLEEADRGAPPGELDAILDREIVGAADAETLDRVTREVRGALAGYSVKMTPEEFARTYDRALRDALRRAVKLPRLTLKSSSRLDP